jgi:hypothetical protein
MAVVKFGNFVRQLGFLAASRQPASLALHASRRHHLAELTLQTYPSHISQVPSSAKVGYTIVPKLARPFHPYCASSSHHDSIFGHHA